MKIAIFHNLRPGGGLNLVNSIASTLTKRGSKIDIFTHQKNEIKKISNVFVFPVKEPSNTFDHLYRAIFTLKRIQKNISKKIINNNYDYVFIFPCNITQAPHLIRFLPKGNTFYFFQETKREFYEKTSFDHFTFKRILSRLIRYPEKILDQINCKASGHIISNSVYSQTVIKKIYKKDSVVIYPGMKTIKPFTLNKKNNHKFLSFGLLTMLKGHHISTLIMPNVYLYGQKSLENIYKYMPGNIQVRKYVKETNKIKMYKSFSFFLANQLNEPFGLTTLEATSNNCYIFGRNEGGTSEIIKNGLNGIFIPINNVILARKIIDNIDKNDLIKFKKTCIIDWNHTVNNILAYIYNV